MKRMLSAVLTAALLLAGFSGAPALAEAGSLAVPQALVETVRAIGIDDDNRFLVYDIDGDGTAELACLYYRAEQHEGWVNRILYCEVYMVSGDGAAVQVYTNGGEYEAGSPGFTLVDVEYEGVRRLAYKYTNFDSTSITDYTVFVPNGAGGVRTRVLHASVDVADQVLPPEYTLDGVPVSQGEFEAVEVSAQELATSWYWSETFPTPFEDQAMTASQFIAAYGLAAEQAPPAEEVPVEEVPIEGETPEPAAPAETGKIAMLTKDTQYTQLGLTVDAGDVGSWTSEHTDYTYDAAGRLVSEQTVRSGEGASAGVTTCYTYDEAGRLAGEQILDGNGSGESGTYEYDADGRLSLVQWYGADGAARRWIRHFYDAAGRETEIIQGYGSVDDYGFVMYTRTGYDDATGRILYQEVINGAQLDPGTHAVLWYDENDTSAAWRDEYTYDGNGALYSWSTQWGGLRSVRYVDGYENVTSMEVYYQDELRRTELYENTYDEQGYLLQTVRSLSGEGVLCTTSYTYGPVGMAVSAQEQPPVTEEQPPVTEEQIPQEAGQPLAAEENYSILRAYWLENVGLDCSGVLADVDGDGLADFIYVDQFTDELLHSYVLTVKNGEVRRIVLQEGIDAHVSGYFNLFVREDEAAGTAELIDYTGAMYQGYGSCSFSVFHLDQEGNRVETNSLVVTDNGVDPISEGQLADFYWQAAQLLDGCVCLYTSGLEYTGALDNVFYPQVSTNWIFDMGIAYE